MEAVRVPPSACSTSQSSQTVRSPSWVMSTTARSERPMRRWISCVRPPRRPRAASRTLRVPVARGSMPYSAVTQPAPLLRRKGGTDSSTEAVQRTRVSPMAIKAEPSAYLFTPVVMVTGRSSSLRRPSTRMVVPLLECTILGTRNLRELTLARPLPWRKGACAARLASAVDQAGKAVLVSSRRGHRKLGLYAKKERHAVASHPLIERARQHGRTLLTELESKQLLHDVGIPTALGQLTTSEAEAVRVADTLGYPVVLKIASPDIVHKSDVGGVRLHLQHGEEVRQAFRAMQQSVTTQAPGARVDGIIVQPMATPGVEVIIGMSKDATFGPVLMFGLGGILVEVLKDVTFRIVPLQKRDAAEMIHDIQGFPLLAGYRGTPPADLEVLQDVLMKLSAFVVETPEVKEIDLNPIYVYAQGALAVDARVVLEEATAKEGT